MQRDPWDDIRRLEKRMNRIFEDFWGGGYAQKMLPSGEAAVIPYEGGMLPREPYTDIQDTGNEVILTADMPGMDKADIRINATEDAVEISAESGSEQEEKKEGYLRKERSYGRFYRRYSLPSAVDPKKAKASYMNGVLEIRLQKTMEKERGTSVKIE